MKERLTGAMILVALIVLLVPELLTGPVQPAQKAAGQSSSAEEGQLRSYTINFADDAHAHGAPSPAASAAPPPASSTLSAGDSPPAAPSAASAPPPAPEPLSPPPASRPSTPVPMARPVTPPPAAGGWVVQLGSFASEANAERLAQQVRSQGFTVGVSQSTAGRHLYRVRVGPVREHTSALQLAQKLSAGGHAGTVEPR